MSSVYLVDAGIYVFRAWFSIPDTLVNSEGMPVNAVRGFFDFVSRFLAETRPGEAAFLFDESLGHSYRHELYPPYKKNRELAPEELKWQFGICRELVSALGISVLSHQHYEADDLVGTLAVQARKLGRSVVIVSSDKDLAQLVHDGDTWWDYVKRRRLDADGIVDHFGIEPGQIADWLALSGDSVDNVPGVPGVGAVTSAKLLQHFGTLDNLIDKLDEITMVKGLRGAERIGGLIREHISTIRLARKLVGIVCDVPLPKSFKMSIGPPDFDGFEALSLRAGFKSHHRKRFESCVKMLRRTEMD